MRKLLSPERLQRYLMAVHDLISGFESVADHVVITDADANIIYMNAAAERITGFSREECIGKNPGDLWGGNMPKEFYEKMWTTIKKDKKPFVGEVQNKKKDGTFYWQEFHISPVLEKDGEVQFFIGIEPAITERKEQEKFREEFVSILAHQLKNPLASFKWTLNWLSTRGNLDEEQREMIDTLYRHNESLIGLVNDLLVFAKIGSIVDLHKEEIDLTVEIENIIQDAKNKHSRLSFSFEKNNPCTLVAYKSLAVQFFTNIIFNAAEYADKESGVVEIHLDQKDNQYVFSCRDNGIGIPEREQEKIFSKFFRASNAKSMKEHGTGLGLFIVKMIADTFGWRVSFQSNIGKGTMFLVIIPKD